MNCPLCGASPVSNETCPGVCGSLEGWDDSSMLNQPPSNRLFGFEWSKGYVAPFLGINEDAARDALIAAGVGEKTIMTDLGCGDGRVCILAASLGANKAVGFDLDESLVARAQQTATEHLQCKRLFFHVRDLFDVDCSPYNLVTVFLLPDTLANERLAKQFRAVLKRGGQVISFGWKVPSLESSLSANHKRLQLTGSKEEYSGLVKQWYLYSS